MDTVLLDGVELTEYFAVVGVRRQLPTPTPNLATVPGGNRYMSRGVDIVPPKISFRLVQLPDADLGRREEARLLARLIIKDRPVELEFSDDDGARYLVVPSGELDPHEYVTSGFLDVEFQAIEATMRGARKSVASEDGVARISVQGDGSPLRVVATATRDAGSYMWGVRMDDGDFMRVELPTQAAAELVIDGDSASVTVNGATAQITLESDWLIAPRGEHEIVRDVGGGEFTVEWEERWL